MKDRFGGARGERDDGERRVVIFIYDPIHDCRQLLCVFRVRLCVHCKDLKTMKILPVQEQAPATMVNYKIPNPLGSS